MRTQKEIPDEEGMISRKVLGGKELTRREFGGGLEKGCPGQDVGKNWKTVRVGFWVDLV